MKAFEKIIGYESVKKELYQVIDMYRNPEKYRKIGAETPRGILLVSPPGCGKTTLCRAFIEESGLKAYTVRKDKNSDDFIDGITEVFREAAENAPAVIFLDDIEKYSNEDYDHVDCPEYVAVQSGMDETADKPVFVIATANNARKLPVSLTRPGRLSVIELDSPCGKDAENIIKYYLSKKKVSEGVSLDDVSKMLSYSSCAALENIINKAAINAAFEGKKEIEMDHIVSVVLSEEYESSGDFDEDIGETEKRKIALHEAGHILIADNVCSGSVGLASVSSSSNGGFIHLCKKLTRRPYLILIALAGKAAVETYYCDTCASGCDEDIEKAYNLIREGVSTTASAGFGMVDVSTSRFPDSSESFNSRSEAHTQAELERYFRKARDIILKNREYLERLADELYEKKTLLYSDICRIRQSVNVTVVEI